MKVAGFKAAKGRGRTQAVQTRWKRTVPTKRREEKNVLRASDGESTVDVDDTGEEKVVEKPQAALAPPKAKSVVVLGGSGFVGSHVCRALLDKGAKVVSVNRSGPPPSDGEKWANQVTWIRADVFDEDSWIDCLEGADAVVSCIGGFGTVADMERVCGDATVNSVGTAKKKSVPKFVFVSVYDYNIPDEIKKRTGYFSGKKRAEEAVLSEFPEEGVVVRPGFIYGDKRVGDVVLPLGAVGKPLEGVLKNLPENLTDMLKKLPASDLALAPPVGVEVVAKAIANAVYDPQVKGVLELKEIERLSEASS